MESKKKLKAQLTNEISKRFSDRIKELEDSRNALRTKIEQERQQYIQLQTKYLNLVEEVEQLKEWNMRLMCFMDLTPENRKQYIEQLKSQALITETFNKYLTLFNHFV